MKRLLFGTANPAKLKFIRTALATVPVDVVDPVSLGIELGVDEDGRTPEENAEKKARLHFAASKMPTLATDAGLYIEKLSPEKQPGVYVRRIYGRRRDVTDEEVLGYYVGELERVGGESPGRWNVAMALMTAADQITVESYVLEVVFSCMPSKMVIPGAPLSSLMMEPVERVYYAEMAVGERLDSERIRAFIQEHLEVHRLS